MRKQRAKLDEGWTGSGRPTGLSQSVDRSRYEIDGTALRAFAEEVYALEGLGARPDDAGPARSQRPRTYFHKLSSLHLEPRPETDEISHAVRTLAASARITGGGPDASFVLDPDIRGEFRYELVTKTEPKLDRG